MQIPRDAMLLRIFIGEDDKCQGHPLYEAIVLKAREMHMAGATILRGPMGVGHSSRLHTSRILRLSEDLPIVIEIVDSEAKIQAFLPELEQMMGSGLVTLERVQVLQYGANDKLTRQKPPSSMQTQLPEDPS
jgi:uncharacterized protein